MTSSVQTAEQQLSFISSAERSHISAALERRAEVLDVKQQAATAEQENSKPTQAISVHMSRQQEPCPTL